MMMHDHDEPLLPLTLPFGPWRRYLVAGGIYIVLWFAASFIAVALNITELGGISLWHLPAGLRFFAMLAFGWSGVFLDAIVSLLHSASLRLLGLNATPFQWLRELQNWLFPILAYSAATLPLRHWTKDIRDFTNPQYSALFLIAALSASALSALASVFIDAVCLDDVTPTSPAPGSVICLSRVVADFIGVITLAPFLLARALPGLRRYLRYGRWRRSSPHSSVIASGYASVATSLLLALALLLVFGIPWSLGLNQHFPLAALLLLPPLAGVTLCCGLRGAVLATLVLDSGLALLIAVLGQHDEALQYQWVMIAIALIGLWLGGAVEARNQLMARYRDFARVSNDLLWEMDAEGRLISVSGRLAEHLALTPGQSWRSLLDQGSPSHRAALERALSQQQPFRHLEIALSGSGNIPRWIQVNGQPLLDELGELRGYRGTVVDVSRQRRAEALLRNYNQDLLREVSQQTLALRQTNSELIAKERHLQVLLAAAPVGVLELDANQCCCFLNANGCLLVGCSPEQALGQHILEFVHPDDRDYVGFIWQINRQSDEVQWLEFRLNRTSLWCAAHWINLGHSDELPSGAIMVLTNATARRQQDERLWTLAHYDTLTELPNRSLFWDRLGQTLRHAKRLETGAAVLWLDLDGFKAVNDALGHAAGDALLQQAALRLKNRIRDSDTVARMGGDEFAVILPDIAEADTAVRVATELVAGLAEPFNLPQGPARISGSAGVAIYPQHAETAEALTQCADMAMYAAKHAGKNQVHVWSEP